MPKSMRAKYARELSAAALQWRHCPFGLHTLLPEAARPSGVAVPYVYITMLRKPLDRMLSWFAYCNKYSPNKCQAGKDYMKKGKGPMKYVPRRYKKVC